MKVEDAPGAGRRGCRVHDAAQMLGLIHSNWSPYFSLSGTPLSRDASVVSLCMGRSICSIAGVMGWVMRAAAVQQWNFVCGFERAWSRASLQRGAWQVCVSAGWFMHDYVEFVKRPGLCSIINRYRKFWNSDMWQTMPKLGTLNQQDVGLYRLVRFCWNCRLRIAQRFGRAVAVQPLSELKISRWHRVGGLVFEVGVVSAVFILDVPACFGLVCPDQTPPND